MVVGLKSAYEALAAQGIKVAGVGPRLVDIRNAQPSDHGFMRSRLGWPRSVTCMGGSEYLEVDFLATSGCLIATSVFEIVGHFAPALFIDLVDMDWCFRASTYGYGVFGICHLTMVHELGTGADSIFLGLTVLGHNPTRRYYYARNTVLLLKRRYVRVGWKARMLIGLIGRLFLLPFAVRFAKGWTADWLMLARGIIDGIAGVGGACRFAP